MGAVESEQELVKRAAAGDGAALEGLLLACHDRLAAALRAKLPHRTGGWAGVEDACQEAYVAAFRQIGRFHSRGDDAFFRWLLKIAEHKLLDYGRRDNAARRGGGRRKLDNQPAGTVGSVADLLELLAVHERTPSRSAAGHEAVAAVQVALDGLEGDYGRALRMRYIDGLPVKKVARQMGRTPRAVHMLCYRGLQKLQELLGPVEKYLGHKA
jgi:RNA polymerase sigma-70 factor (ECF subfamily)